ncbi:AAA family ATPase [Sinorhizobium americanum]|uniref:CpaE2 pilus assembly protein n=1 Tax=Sinorhizobium americanum TaxID=194963 RepID=A0A1L3LQ32_9HYPH|nr:AAA family ATPase [Sinorhizobium americanum]APG92228.1 CpaE2 pilus assembly protein [Sinorhizobium americanum]OAP34635.1 pilus assembly protein CpaE [Sinorhizobium americanum]
MKQLNAKIQDIPREPVAPLLSIPKVDIAVFCRSEALKETIGSAAVDRRMARASVTVKEGGLKEATALYAGVTSPNLVVVENTEDEERLMNALEALAVECVTGTKVIVVGSSNDVGLYKRLVDAGVSDYLVMPLDPIDFVAAVHRCFRDSVEEKLGRIVAFIGAKGGTGSSTLAHNVAYAMSKRVDADVLVADLDLQFGTLGLDFDVEAVQGMTDILSSPERLDDVLLRRLAVPYTEHLHLLPTTTDLNRFFYLKEEHVDHLLDVARSSAWQIVVDLPHIWMQWTRKILLEADEIVITATPDLASMRNVKNLVDLLKKARPNDPPPRLVLNRTDTPKLAEIKPKDFVAAVGLEESVSVPFDPQLFGKAANNGQLVIESASESKAGQAIVSLAWRVGGTRERRARKKGIAGLVQRFTQRRKQKAAAGLRKKAQELKKSEAGASAVEFALFAPVLALGLVAMADVALALHERMTIDHVLRAGAQAAMADPGATQVDKVLQSTLAQSATPANVALAPVQRYCACPENANVNPEAAPQCGTTPCANSAQQLVFYRLQAAKNYQPMSLPEALPPFQLNSSMQVQVR